MALASLTEGYADTMLDRIVEFEDGSRFERLKHMTNFRKDDSEARILYLCRRVSEGASQTENFVMKIKVQVPSTQPHGQKTPIKGPSLETAAELQALKTFAKNKRTTVPQLVTWRRISQGSESLFPEGYVVFTVMTLMPGETLLDLGFWSLPVDEQESIRVAFLAALKDVWRDGFEPYDRALRNILWEAKTQTCSIVDFEYWRPAKAPENMNENEEMQRWGIVRRPASNSWWEEWNRSAA